LDLRIKEPLQDATVVRHYKSSQYVNQDVIIGNVKDKLNGYLLMIVLMQPLGLVPPRYIRPGHRLASVFLLQRRASTSPITSSAWSEARSFRRFCVPCREDKENCLARTCRWSHTGILWLEPEGQCLSRNWGKVVVIVSMWITALTECTATVTRGGRLLRAWKTCRWI